MHIVCLSTGHASVGFVVSIARANFKDFKVPAIPTPPCRLLHCMLIRSRLFAQHYFQNTNFSSIATENFYNFATASFPCWKNKTILPRKSSELVRGC